MRDVDFQGREFGDYMFGLDFDFSDSGSGIFGQDPSFSGAIPGTIDSGSPSFYSTTKYPGTTDGITPTLSISPTIKLPSFGSTSGGSSGPTARQLATNTVNQFEPYFKSNRDTYLSQPASRDAQIEALNRFDSLWQQLVTALSRLGQEGQLAIRDRMQGGGHSWFQYYRDPIEKDTRLGPFAGTQPGVNTGGGILPNLTDVTSNPLMTFAVIALLVLIVVKVIK